MQLLEDNDIIDSGDMAKRIAVLREKVQQLLKNNASSDTTSVSSQYNDDLVEEIRVLKSQLSKKGNSSNSEEFKALLKENELLKKQETNDTVSESEEYKTIVKENQALKKQLENGGDAVDRTIINSLKAKNAKLKTELASKSDESDGAVNENVMQENIMLKKQIANREKTIKELDFKLEMFKLAKSLRAGAGIDTKSEELKKIITEYIKEIDVSIASLNIE